jgi:hypothetical protein
MITINYRGRYCNNLFQLSAANILSKKYNKRIIGNIRSNILKINEPNQISSNKETININDRNFIKYYNNSQLSHNNIILNGFFQQPEIISEFIKHNEYVTNQDSKDLTFMHIRLGDFVKNGMALDYDYYELALSEVDTNNFVLSTDDENNDIVKKILDKYNPTLIKDTPENTILFGASCKNKILSYGTFSWWIGFLGNTLHKDTIESTLCPNMNRRNVFHPKIFPMFDWITL